MTGASYLEATATPHPPAPVEGKLPRWEGAGLAETPDSTVLVPSGPPIYPLSMGMPGICILHKLPGGRPAWPWWTQLDLCHGIRVTVLRPNLVRLSKAPKTWGWGWREVFRGTHCRVKDGKLQMLAVRTTSVSITQPWGCCAVFSSTLTCRSTAVQAAWAQLGPAPLLLCLQRSGHFVVIISEEKLLSARDPQA